MANLTVRDLPDDLYARLREQAKAHRRSITAETTVILERALGGRAMREDELFRRADELRERTPVHLTEKDRKEATRRGRA